MVYHASHWKEEGRTIETKISVFAQQHNRYHLVCGVVKMKSEAVSSTKSAEYAGAFYSNLNLFVVLALPRDL